MLAECASILVVTEHRIQITEVPDSATSVLQNDMGKACRHKATTVATPPQELATRGRL